VEKGLHNMKAVKKSKTEEPFQQILNRLGNIEHKVESIDETNAFALRAEEDEHQKTVKKIFKRGKRRAQVYLAADGTRGVVEIAKHLGMKTPNVSPQLKALKLEGLLVVASIGRQDFWGKKTIDRTLRISQYLCKEYSLKADGRPGALKKKKK
jgi:predicted Rossmann fold nucleotide-binding protein DprA/Smf involved in DNA uptake